MNYERRKSFQKWTFPFGLLCVVIKERTKKTLCVNQVRLVLSTTDTEYQTKSSVILNKDDTRTRFARKSMMRAKQC